MQQEMLNQSYQGSQSGLQEQAHSEQQEENFIYQIFDCKDFSSVEDQVIVPFRDTGIPDYYESFSITLNFILKKNESKRKENLTMFQTGQTHKKNLIIAITPQNTLKVTFRQGQEQEFMYSQTKVKPNISYDLCIVYEVVREQDEIMFYNITLYLNGKSETNLSLNSEITKPSGNIYFGSESALGTFVGEISHAYFVTRNLSEGEIISLHNEKKLNPMDPKNPHAILEEAQQSQFGGGNQDLHNASRRSVPATLQRTHITILQNHISGQSQMVVLDNKSIKSMNKQQFEQAELNAIFSRDPYLEQQFRQLSYHFKWVMCTLQQLSPPIEEIGKASLPFTCLQNLIASGRIQSKLSLPLYIIEFRRFMKVLRYADIRISEESIMQIANITKTYYEFKTDDPEFEDFQKQFRQNYGCIHMNVTKQSEEDEFKFKGVVYDKLLIAIRDTVLLPEEVDNIRREYSDVPGVIDEVNMEEATPVSTKKSPQKRIFTQNSQQDVVDNKAQEEETRKRQELANQLYEEKLKILNCQPLLHYQAGQNVIYNSYNALLNLLEISKKDISEANLYVFKGIFLQRTYLGANIQYPNILELHRKFFQTIASKGNIFSQMDIIFKNMCNQGQEELDFNSFFNYWTKSISGNDSKSDVQQVFEDLQITKNGFITIKDMYYYFQSYEIVFLYQKKDTDTHVMFGLYNNQTEENIVRSEICPNNYSSIRSMAFTSKRHPKTDQKFFILHSLKQTYRNEKNEMVDLKAFDNFVLDQNAQYELQELSYSPVSPQDSYGIEITVNLTVNQEVFGNHQIDYSLLQIKPLYKHEAEASQQIVKQINEKHKQILGPIAHQQAEPQSPTVSPRAQSDIGPDEIEEREQLPVPDPSWNQGKFIINVNRCTHCDTHTTTTWHDEVDFIEKFNHFGESMKQVFPNCDIVGNYDKPGVHYENFDVYIRGVGPEQDRDSQGRIWLYSKTEGIFSFLYYFGLRILKAYDKLVLLASGYGNTVEMEKVQEYYLSRFESMIPQKWAESHSFPLEVPKRKVEIQREIEEENMVKEGTRMICRNWGCGKQYEFTADPISTKYACRYHPGTYQLGSIHALWPESWTCCRGEWASQGCRKGPHKGVVEKKYLFLCLNVGEINPKTKRPDSACGKLYNDDFPSDCLIHPGYFKRSKPNSEEGEWTCCQDGNPSLGGCQPQKSHTKAEWPDVEAKKYFVEKQITNPGLIKYDGKKLPVISQSQVEPYKKAALRACVYRESLPYTPFVNQEKRKKEERKLNENELRVCIHYGCIKKIDGRYKHLVEFSDIENDKFREKRKRNCRYHPGTFDFGHTGVTSVSQASTDTLWKPHWTCCRQEWESEGCEKGYHDGPLLKEFVEELREKAKAVYDEWKQKEDFLKQIKMQEDHINDRFSRDEVERNNELAKLPMRYNQQDHMRAQEIVQAYSTLLDQAKKNNRVLIDFYDKEFWPNIRAQKRFQKQISSLWKSKLEGYKVGEHEVKGLYVDANDLRNYWQLVFKKEESVSFGRLPSLCDKLHLHLFAVSDRLDYHYKFWDIVNKDLQWLTNTDTITREQFIEWWFMETDEYLERKESYKEEQRRKQQQSKF
ncbi:hypothetical protein ABPG74_013505 [Tetrahymena malaccensis]